MVLINMAPKRSECRSPKSSPVTDKKGLDILGLDDAVHALADLDERQSRVFELRFFGGLSVRRPPRCSIFLARR